MRCMEQCRYKEPSRVQRCGALYIALVHLDDAGAGIHTDNVGVVQALERGAEHGICADRNDIDGWALIWQQLRAIEEHKYR